MDVILKEVKKVAITLGVMSALIIIVTLIAGLFDITIILSVIYGFVFCELNFILLGTVVDKALTMSPRRAKRHMQVNYAVRLIILAVILTIPFVVPFLNGWCTVIMMLAPKFTYFAIGFFALIPKRKEKDKIEH